jgi:hypothetical protein
VFDTCVHTILNETNKYIKTRTGIDEDCVIYANYADLQYQQRNDSIYKNRILVSVVDIVQETTNQNPTTYIQQGNNYIIKNLPANFYVYMLFAANYKDSRTVEGLKYLASVIAFFQSKNHFTIQNTPTLQVTNLEEFSAFPVKLDYQQKRALWGCLSTTYLPSVLYKIGIIPITDIPEIWPEIPAISTINNPS